MTNLESTSMRSKFPRGASEGSVFLKDREESSEHSTLRSVRGLRSRLSLSKGALTPEERKTRDIYNEARSIIDYETKEVEAKNKEIDMLHRKNDSLDRELKISKARADTFQESCQRLGEEVKELNLVIKNMKGQRDLEKYKKDKEIESLEIEAAISKPTDVSSDAIRIQNEKLMRQVNKLDEELERILIASRNKLSDAFHKLRSLGVEFLNVDTMSDSELRKYLIESGLFIEKIQSRINEAKRSERFLKRSKTVNPSSLKRGNRIHIAPKGISA